MISARAFCREPSFPTTLFLTYSFDPLFFERIPLADLDKGGSRRILVVADGSQLRDAIQASKGQLVHLGRRYVLAETVCSNTFHPKLIVRLSAKKGRVWLGSGNLTHAGWGGNREVASAWSIGPGEPDKGMWLRPLLDRIGTETRSTLYARELDRVYDLAPWLNDVPSETGLNPLLFGTPDRPLGPQLAERWQGRRFEEVRLCTGSTDANGAFLAWAHRTFGVSRAIICLNPAFASFDKEQLAKLPLEIRIVKPDENARMHAKFYWFGGAGGNAALIGSANCSAAAWIAGGGHGNFEAVVPFDAPDEAEFANLLVVFKGKRHSPEKVLLANDAETAKFRAGDVQAYRLVNLHFRSTGRLVEVILEPRPPKTSEVELVIQNGSQSFTIRLVAQRDNFVAVLPLTFAMGQGTVFAYATVRSARDTFDTDVRWIDNEAALSRAAAEGLSEPGLADLSRRAIMNANQQQILEAIHAVSARLLHDRMSTSGANRTSGGSAKPQDSPVPAETALVAIDPAATLRSLAELISAAAAKSNFFTIPSGSLAGVMAMLFSREAEEVSEDIDLSNEAWTGDNPELASDDADDIKGSLERRDETPITATIENPTETRLRFQEQLRGFLHELAAPRFVETCTPTTMVQALAFPLLVCVRVGERGWLAPNFLVDIAVRVVTIMLKSPYGKGKPDGLFKNVQERFRHLGLSDEFLRAVGDGTLWSALLAALGGDSDPAPRRFIFHAEALNKVVECRELIAFASPDRLKGLAQASIIPTAEQAVMGRIGLIRERLSALEALLTAREATVYASQGGGRSLQSGGALLWSSRWGWKLLSSQPAQAYCSGYIDIDRLAKTDADIRNAMVVLASAMRDSSVVESAPIPNTREES